MPATHPLAARAAVQPVDLDGVELIWFPRRFAPGLHDAALAELAAAGARFELSDSTMSWSQRRAASARRRRVSLSTARRRIPRI